MNVLFIILIAIAGILLIVLIAAAALKDEYVVERNIVINRPKQDVFAYIRLLKNQEQYNKWVMMDPGMKKTYTGTDGTVGAVSAWDSNDKQVGKGEQEITSITENERVDQEVRFERPFKSTSQAWMSTTAAAGNQTNVSWGLKGHRSYGMKIFHLLLNISKMLGKDLETSLGNLKNVLEK